MVTIGKTQNVYFAHYCYMFRLP